LSVNFYTEFRGDLVVFRSSAAAALRLLRTPSLITAPCGCGSGRQQCCPLLDVVWMRGQPLFCADCRDAWTSCNCRSAVLEMLCSFDHVLDVSATQMPDAVSTSVCSDYSESFYCGAML
jgi:hypothetical protein